MSDRPATDRVSWDDYFFEIARVVATRATCPRAQIGCVIVDGASHRLLASGYNGAPSGEAHCTEVDCTILADHCVRAIHAEVNAAKLVPPPTLEWRAAYVVGPRPVCSHCARTLHQAGVRRVYWRDA